MSIANELSSEVAAAVLARETVEGFADKGELKNIIVEVHDTLRRMTAEGRKARRRSRESAATPEPHLYDKASSSG
jgi:predicted transcriptional regulator